MRIAQEQNRRRLLRSRQRKWCSRLAVRRLQEGDACIRSPRPNMHHQRVGHKQPMLPCQDRDTKVQRRDLEQLPTIETQLSGLPSSLIRNGVHLDDKRCEYCSKCSRCVPHDLISLFNMLSIATAILLRKPRPDYLCPSWAEKKQEEELGVAAQH